VSDQTFDQMRRAMVVSQLRTTAVSDPRVLAAMGEVPRERFVPPENASLAYTDSAIPLGQGRALNPPMVIGRLLTEARVGSGDRVLLIGAGTGYSAELLGKLAGSVAAVEQDKALLAQAREAVTSPNVHIVEGDLAAGWADGAPYDLILIDGAVEEVPPALIDQLADGGRLAAVIVERGVTRLAIGRRAGGGFGMSSFADAAAATLPGFARAVEFSF
jgi:protein-L-isoaspartate(D-aspartate) O-methyltransferase